MNPSKRISKYDLIQNFIEDVGVAEGDINEDQYIRWITDCSRMVNVADQHYHYFSVIQIENFKGQLPENYEKTQQVLGRAYVDPTCSRQTKVSQWLYNTLDEDCELEVNLICKRCSERGCSCEAPVLELDVDTIWRNANPQWWKKGYTSYGSVGKGENLNGHIDTRWQLLRPAMSDMFLHKYFLGDCPNFGLDESFVGFKIEGDIISVDFPEGKGEVILSYMGTPLDDEGDVTIPEHIDLISAIHNHMKYKYFDLQANRYIVSNKTAWQGYQAKADRALAMREISFGQYRGSVSTPDYKTFNEFLQKVWLIHPDIDYERNLKRGHNISSRRSYRHYLETGRR